ncbi:uncharacterized protein LOC135836338 [Planococcus citri]|uniref:uncharacterized protein LOC135836338 n=1 Tax=Planococcus citri TaxID=170843 RepID=UPI0031F7DE23
MANGRIRESEVPLCAFVTLLLTHCYSVFAILDRRVYVDEDLRRNYRLEDFLWSGSGDGENETEPSPVDESTPWERITTVFHTTTVVSTATIFYKTVSVSTTESNTTSECINDPDCIIEPTPTIQLSPGTAISPWPPPTEYPYGDFVPDQRYWLITILKVNTSSMNFVPDELEDHLAKLYKIAFHRHQEHHLGLNGNWNKSSLRSQQIFRQKRDQRDKVTVHIHNVTNDEALKILYSVKVSGHPVLATAAAHDMKLVSDAEAVAELGFPILTKAEPYLKPLQTPEGNKLQEKEFLYVLVSSICAVILVVLFVLLLLLTVKKHNKRKRMEDRKTEGQQFFKKEDDRNGIDNEAFLQENITKSERQHSAAKQRNAKGDFALDGSHGAHQSQCHLRPHSRKPVSPNSFLSMPSVRDFPTTPLPEPLTNVLNNSPSTSQDKPPQMFSRHGSLEAEDPGILGPMVWNTHCHRLKKQGGLNEDDDQSSFDSDIDVGRMRRRFNDLLDDALSLYETHRTSHHHHHEPPPTIVHESKNKNFDLRSQSAAHFREAENVTVSRVHSRPKTSLNVNEQRRISTQKSFPQPRDAWDTSKPTTPARLHSRPLSAGPFHRPTIYPELILSDAQLSPNDPAVPIISAIKKELDKIPSYRPTTQPRKFVTLREPYGDNNDHEV